MGNAPPCGSVDRHARTAGHESRAVHWAETSIGPMHASPTFRGAHYLTLASASHDRCLC